MMVLESLAVSTAFLLALIAYADWREGKVPSFAVLLLLLSGMVLSIFSGHSARVWLAAFPALFGAFLALFKQGSYVGWADWLVLAALALMLQPQDFFFSVFVASAVVFLGAAQAYLFKKQPFFGYRVRWLPVLIVSVALSIFI